MANADSFSTSTILTSLQDLRFAAATEPITEMYPAVPPPPCGLTLAIPPPRFAPPVHPCPRGFCVALAPQELGTRLQWLLFNLMTKSGEEDGVAPFIKMISKIGRRELQGMASVLTSDSDYFLTIARNKNGSTRLQKLLGKSDDADGLFCAAISRRILHVLTDKHASHVAIRGLRVFDDEKKEFMCVLIIRHALHLACDKYGCGALNEIITDLDHPYYRNQLLDVVANNALWLSNDAVGNFAVQNVLKLKDSRCMRNVSLNLRGHCIDLAFKKYGSYTVERLLEADESVPVVVMELLECDGDRLMRLARSEFGSFVVGKALRITQEKMVRADLFRGLVDKLMPFLPFLRRSQGSNIAAFLESIQ